MPAVASRITAAMLLMLVVARWGVGDSSSSALEREVVVLGSDELVDGIPGDGVLTLAEIETWLSDRRNHVELDPRLPIGLAPGAVEIEGLRGNPLTRAKIELGRQLYFDSRLSRDHTVSCATCHNPNHGFADDSKVSLGVDNQAGGRNSPVAYNRIFSANQFWDGRAATLEEQALGPIANPVEMANTLQACVDQLATINGYHLQFERIFPDGLTIENVAKAIACFERSLVTETAPWDHYARLTSFKDAYADDLEYLDELKVDDPELFEEYQQLVAASETNPISDSAIRGSEVFFGKANCSVCHNGANFTDELYHNLGVGFDGDEPDWGRFELSEAEADRGAFKTPTLRNVEQTAPYMHDGSLATLAGVVDWYDEGGHHNEWLSEEIEPLELSDREKADLVEFIKALTGRLPNVERGRLPE